MVDNAQLLPRVVAGTQTRTRFEHSTFHSEGQHANQYTTIASTALEFYCPYLGSETKVLLPSLSLENKFKIKQSQIDHGELVSGPCINL